MPEGAIHADFNTCVHIRWQQYGNLTPYGSTLWVRVKRHAIHHGCIVLCTEDTWKATTRVHRLHMTRMVENTLLVAEGICGL